MGEYYQTEECFRRYELVIATALRKYPEPVRFKSSKRKITTDSARCSNAITSYRTNRWLTSDPIFAEFENCPLACWIDRDVCVIGPPKSNDNVVMVVQSGVGDGEHGALQLTPTRREHVSHLITLLNDGVLTNPVKIPKVWAAEVEQLSEGLINIAFTIQDESILIF